MEIKVKRKPYFYDRQIKRYLVQLLACFAGYQVMTGTQRDGKSRFLDAPIIYGDFQQAFAYTVNGGSDNAVASLPLMSLYMTGMRQKAEWRQNPQHWEYYNYVERKKDGDGNYVINEPGKRVTIERYMPVPYDMDFEVSVWASNNDQGFQIVEQIATQYNPDMDIQLSNSPADWIFLTSVIFQGEIRMEKSIPQGEPNPDPRYVFTMPFSTVVYMSPPAKVYTAKPIYEIQVPIKDLERSLDFDSMVELDRLVIRADEEDIIESETLK